jgi:hypothetical protein
MARRIAEAVGSSPEFPLRRRQNRELSTGKIFLKNDTDVPAGGGVVGDGHWRICPNLSQIGEEDDGCVAPCHRTLAGPVRGTRIAACPRREGDRRRAAPSSRPTGGTMRSRCSRHVTTVLQASLLTAVLGLIASSASGLVIFEYEGVCDISCDGSFLSLGDPITGRIGFIDGTVWPPGGPLPPEASLVGWSFSFGPHEAENLASVAGVDHTFNAGDIFLTDDPDFSLSFAQEGTHSGLFYIVELQGTGAGLGNGTFTECTECTTIPEPTGVGLLAFGLGAIAWRVRHGLRARSPAQLSG